MTVSPEEKLVQMGAQVAIALPEQEPAPPPKAPLRSFASDAFVLMKLKPREYILEPILRTRGLAMLSAFRGVGKTQFALGVSHAVATAGKFLNWRAPVARNVLYVDGEMPGPDLQQRLLWMEPVTSGKLRILPMDEQDLGISLNLSQSDDQKRLESVLGNTELLVLDNRSTLVSGGRENEAESWDCMQAWLLRMRRQGVCVLLVEHEGRGGNPRGTSKREDILETLISLKRPDDYSMEDGARFEVHLGKARGVFGQDAKPFEAKLEVRDNRAEWTVRDLQNAEALMVADLVADGKSIRDIANDTGISKSRVHRIMERLKMGEAV